MRLEGQFTVSAARPDVYAFLTDPATVSRHMPDVKNVVIAGCRPLHRYRARRRVAHQRRRGDEARDHGPAAPISTTVVGRGTGLASAVDVVTSFTLESAETGETVVHWRGDVTISGKLAAFGPQGLLDRIARKNIDTFIEAIRRGLAESASP